MQLSDVSECVICTQSVNFKQTTRCNIPEGYQVQSRGSENLRSHKKNLSTFWPLTFPLTAFIEITSLYTVIQRIRPNVLNP